MDAYIQYCSQNRWLNLFITLHISGVDLSIMYILYNSVLYTNQAK